MSKKMLINASHPEENRVAIVVDGILSELDIEIAGQEQTKGNIYKAVVVRVEPGLQAAFVDYGAEKMGFLQIGEIHPNLYPDKENPDIRNRPRINDILKRGQELLVQIVKEERGTKGAALTTFLSLPGRYMVLMPDSKTKGVSRKISDEKERKELKRNMAALDLPDRMGYIVRTAGIGKEPEELKRDFDYLVSLYQGILNRKEQVKAPAQLYQESNLAIRSIRDYFSSEMDEVLIDDPGVFRDAKDFFSLVMPEQAGLVKQHREKRPIFSRYQIEEQIDGLSRNQTPLPSGGSIVIDQTEALVAIDVNSGKMSSESGIEATAGKTNLEAAAEIGRQLRLRDLGGLIVIDFIDMRDRKRIREVEDMLRKSLRDDKAKVTVGRISQFGLLEMSRQRIKAALSVGAYLDCPHCKGKGRVKSVEAQAIALLRQLHAAASKGQIGKVEARVPLDVANYLLNEKRSTLTALEKQLDLAVSIAGRPEFIPGQVDVELHKREKQQQQEEDSAPISHANQIEGALAAAQQDKHEEENPEVEQTAPIETGDDPVTTEEVTGRKRRRRRRKRSDRRETTEQQTISADPEISATVEDDSPGEPSPAEELVSNDASAVTGEAKQAKPRSRRSPRKASAAKAKEESEQVPSAAGIDPQPAQEAGTIEVEPKEKPKRPSRRKSPARKAAESAEQVRTEHGQVEPATEPAQPLAEKTASEPGRKKRPARRSSALKKSAGQTAATAADESSPQIDISAEAAEPVSTGGETVKEKTQRRTRKKPKAAAEAEHTGSAQQQNATEQEADAEQTERKPKRRAPRKTPSPKASETPREVAADDVAAAPDSEKKPQRRTRKTAAASQEKNLAPREQADTAEKTERKPKPETVAAQEGKDAVSSEAKAASKPKRSATRKTPTKKTDEGNVSAASEQAETKPKRRAPRKKTPPKTKPSSTSD
ncbi:MAG: Rne/Rng family ribonuclease [Desulfuromonadales bacterium]|nr:Rne/Rng family ribonuclease [Desulfuromonadales bacterium]